VVPSGGQGLGPDWADYFDPAPTAAPSSATSRPGPTCPDLSRPVPTGRPVRHRLVGHRPASVTSPEPTRTTSPTTLAIATTHLPAASRPALTRLAPSLPTPSASQSPTGLAPHCRHPRYHHRRRHPRHHHHRQTQHHRRRQPRTVIVADTPGTPSALTASAPPWR
jgi:hypothetical protein